MVDSLRANQHLSNLQSFFNLCRVCLCCGAGFKFRKFKLLQVQYIAVQLQQTYELLSDFNLRARMINNSNFQFPFFHVVV
jgi:hypothetical protein